MERHLSIPLGVVIAREAVEDPWIDHVWQLRAVFPGAPEITAWKELRRGTKSDGSRWVEYHAATLPLELHAKETESYRVNLADARPSVYVVMHEADDDADEGEGTGEGNDAPPLVVRHVTVSAFEAQDYLDSGEEMVEAAPMPAELRALVEAFVEAHHVEEKFIKRKQRKVNVEEHKFGQEPIFLRRDRAGGGKAGR